MEVITTERNSDFQSMNNSEVSTTLYQELDTKRNASTLESVGHFVNKIHPIQNRKESCYIDLCETAALEIALEGLDGITIEALWTRISAALGDSVSLTDSLKSYFWESICYRPDMEFYELKEARPDLVLFDRFQNLDSDLGLVLDVKIADIYEHCAVTDKTKAVFGSCKMYNKRRLISESVRSLSWMEAYRLYKNSLVIVASQSLRRHALYNDLSDPELELLDSQYCVLERIGRSRKQGEITQGKMSLQCISKDPKTIFYYRRLLEKHFLITKQVFIIKSTTGNVSGNILHLVKFYNEKKTKPQILTEKIASILKQKPNYQMDYAELKKHFSNYEEISKLMKLPHFQKFVKTDVLVPYRVFYPEAKEKEWKTKSDKEKMIRSLVLVNPQLNITSCWNEDESSELSSDDDALDDISLNESLLTQVYNIIHDSGTKGLSIKEVEYLTQLDFYTIRGVLRILVKRKVIRTRKVDHKKQRLVKYLTKDSNENENEVKETKEDKELLKKSNQFLSNLLGIDLYHLESPPAAINQDEFENSLKSLTNISSNSNVLISKLRRDINHYKVMKRRQSDSLAEMSNNDTFEDKSSEFEEKHRKSAEKYKKLLEIESNICKNTHTFLDCKQETLLEIFPKSTSGKFTEICQKIIKTKERGISSSVFCNTYVEKEKDETQLESIEYKRSSQVRKAYQVFFSIFLKYIPTVCISFKEVAVVTCQCLPLANLSELYSIFDIENRLKQLFTSHFNFEFSKILFENLLSSEVNQQLLEEFSRNATTTKYQNTQNIKQTQDVKAESDSLNYLPITKKRKRKLIHSENETCKKQKITPHESPTNQIITNILENTTTEKDNELVDTTEENSKEIYRTGIDVRLMGAKPTLLKKIVDEDNVEILYYISTVPKEYASEESRYKNEYGATVQKNTRANKIIQFVRQEKVFPDLHNLHKLISKIEQDEGYKWRIDRKSLERIIGRLVSQGFMKVIKIIVKFQSVVRTKYIVCHPTIEISHYLITATLEQMKMKMKISVTQKQKVKVKSEPVRPKPSSMRTSSSSSNVASSVGQLKNLTSASSGMPYKYHRMVGKQYGYSPKFVRARILHEFLFYLIYGYDNETNTAEIVELLKEAKIHMDKEDIEKLPVVYKHEVNWKMFISPLPHHAEWTKGWALVCDLLLRVPLSIFVKLHNVTFIIPDLQVYLQHPIKQYLPVKHLPVSVLNGILYKRKYLFSFHENLILLCHMGLLQFGPQNMKEKDNLFIYLNQNASLWDTSTSKAGYHQIEEKEYKVQEFNFSTMSDVESYWYRLWTIAIHTNLGQRYAILGQTININNVRFKPSMLEAQKSKTCNSATQDDNGSIPGDHKGAAGLDSALWVHLKRNWAWTTKYDSHYQSSTQSVTSIKGVRKRRLEETVVKPIKFADLQNIPKMQGQKKIEVVTYKTDKNAVNARNALPAKPKQLQKGKCQVRKILPRKEKKRRTFIDEIDHKIMKQMKKSRCTWTKAEDDILIILRTAALYLYGNLKRQVIPFNVIRDILHKFSSKSLNKTSKACQRRIVWLFNSPDIVCMNETQENLVKQSVYIRRIFGPIRKKISNCKITRKELFCAFVVLAGYLLLNQHEFYRKRNEEKKNTNEARVIDYLTSEKIVHLEKANLMLNNDTDVQPLFFTEPLHERQIAIETVKSIVHSSLSCKAEKLGWTFQMFQVYQRYPEQILRKAIKDLRRSEMISVKKKKIKRKEKNVITATPFQFNIKYTFNQHMVKFSAFVYPHAYNILQKIFTHESEDTDNPITSYHIRDFSVGNTLGLSELFYASKITFSLNIPEEPLTLNPNIVDHSELIRVLAVRYKRFLTMIKDGTYFNEELNTTTKNFELQNDDQDEVDQTSYELQNQLFSVSPNVPGESFITTFSSLASTSFDQSTECLKKQINNNKTTLLFAPNPLLSAGSDHIIEHNHVSKEFLNKSGIDDRCVSSNLPMENNISNTFISSSTALKQLSQEIGFSSQSQISSKENTRNAIYSMVESVYNNLGLDDLSDDQPDSDMNNVYGNLKHSQAFDFSGKNINFLGNEEDGEDYEEEGDDQVEEEINIEQRSNKPAISSEMKPSNMKSHKNNPSYRITDLNNLITLNHTNHTVRLKQSDFKNKCKISSKKKNISEEKQNVRSINIHKNGRTENPVKLSLKDETAAGAVLNSVQKAAMGNFEILNMSVGDIMKKIVENDSEQERQIPSPTKLVFLLKKDFFPDDSDEYLEKLDQHYIINCPEGNLHIADKELYKYFQNEFPSKYSALINKIVRNAVVPPNPSSDARITEELQRMGCNVNDLTTFKGLIEYVKSKKVLGVPLKTIKEKFSNSGGNLKLLDIVRVLIRENEFYLSGVTCLKCIHYFYRKQWTSQWIAIKKEESLKHETNMEVQILPWIRVNGTLNIKILEDWLCLALTTCLTYPLANIEKLTKELTYLKPVETYYLYDYLQDLGCVKLIAYEKQNETLFSTYMEPTVGPATEFHDFSEICVEPSVIAANTLGAFVKARSHEEM